MVDKNVAFNRDGRSEEFAENDPLAELARIVGYEDRPRHVSPQAASAAGIEQRRDPSFNLEDELLREFAIYDAPREEARVAANDAAIPAAEPIHANDFLQRVEDVFARREPEFTPEPEPHYVDDYQIPEAPIGDALRYTMNAQPQNYGNEIYADPQSYAPEPVPEPLYAEPRYEEPQYQEPVYQETARAAPAYEEPAYQEPVDLTYEVEQSVVDEPAYQADHAYSEPAYVEPNYTEPTYQPAPAPAADIQPELNSSSARVQQGARSSLEFSSLRQPLGNFAMSRATPFIPKTPPVSQTPVHVPAAAPEEPIFTPFAQPANNRHSDLDALIADVSRYSIGTTDRSSQPAAPVAARHEPVTTGQAEPTFDLTDDAFEAALDDMDFEFDLTELDLSEGAKSHAPAPVFAEPTRKVAQDVAQPNFAERPAVAAAPTAVAAARPQAIAHNAPASVQLPFDLDQIGDTEDQPETLAEFDVPDLPPLHVEPKAPAQRHEDELDLDTELAALFTASNTGFDRSRGGEKPAAPQVAAKAPDVDEFERALEEDFRRSLQENPTKPNKIQTTPSDGYDEFDADSAKFGQSHSGKRWMMPSIAAIGALVVVGGVYAAFFGGSSTTTGSDGLPVVIAADNEPMKVIPAEPGGRVVPNQDKAVYDRVSGNALNDPKQPSLISSDEEPVDVVQHTLIPEQVAIDDEGDFASGAEALDTVDPRLLPAGQQEHASAQTPAETPVNVSPRRVRTMIVKPDGTLVTQEVDAPSAAETAPAPSAAPVAPATVVEAPAPAAQTPAPVSLTPVPVVAAPAAVAPTPPAAAVPAPAPAPTPVPVVAAAPEAPAQTNVASSGGYYIQIASLPSDAEAQKTYKSMSSKFGSVIGGRGVDIKRADIAGKGTYYRVRIPAGDRSAANALCQRFQSAGGSCLVTR